MSWRRAGLVRRKLTVEAVSAWCFTVFLFAQTIFVTHLLSYLFRFWGDIRLSAGSLLVDNSISLSYAVTGVAFVGFKRDRL